MFAFGIVLFCFGVAFLVFALIAPAILMIYLAIVGTALFIGGCVLMAGGAAADAFRRAATTPPAASAPKAVGASAAPVPATKSKTPTPAPLPGPTTLTAATVTPRSILFQHEAMIDLALSLAPGEAALAALVAYLQASTRSQAGAETVDWPALKARLKERRPTQAAANAALSEIAQWPGEAKDRAADTLAEIYRAILAPDPAFRTEIGRALGRAV